MSEASQMILDKLKQKKQPKEKKEIIVRYSKPEKPIVIETPIEDKRTTTKINRDEILNRLGKKPAIYSEIPKAIIKKEEETFLVEDTADTKLKTEQKVKSLTKPAAPMSSTELTEEDESLLLAALEGEPIDLLPSKPKKTSSQTVTKKSKIKISTPGTIITKPPEQIDILNARLPKSSISISASPYFLNNREIFVNFITSLLEKYSKEIKENIQQYSCDSKDDLEFTLLTHQRIVREYINLVTPYRGLLLYHGLGSGKTCSSIAIAEGIKTDREVIIMLPASLEVNYREELKKCGDLLYKKNQYWEKIDTNSNPALIQPLSYILGLTTEYIKKMGGAWLVNASKKSNYMELDSIARQSLDDQINKMIDNKYKFIRYNGLRQRRLDQMVSESFIQGLNGNPFSNKVIVIDEAHNFISRIVNKLKKPKSLAIQLYNYLKSAENSRIVMLSGTPIINYPNELAIMMNILRGNIRTWSFQLKNKGSYKLTKDSIIALLKSNPLTNNLLDYLQFKSTPEPNITITRNPFGYYSQTSSSGDYLGVQVGEEGAVSDENFLKLITEVLATKDIEIVEPSITVTDNTCLPDTLDDFSEMFINTSSKEDSNVMNMDLFKRRILGLVSYFPDIEELLPKYDKVDDLDIIRIPMSKFQFSVYEEARVQERKIEKNNAKKRAKQSKGGADGLYEEAVSTYRIFSRAFCNFVFPRPDIIRPLPNSSKEISNVINESANEDLVDAIIETEEIDEETGVPVTTTVKADEQGISKEETITYAQSIRDALRDLNDRREEFLTPSSLETYSPKFLNILSRLVDAENVGSHLIYSQFRTLEGIGILSLVLKANGFAQFKIAKVGTEWRLDLTESDYRREDFVGFFILYTGTEGSEEKEILRNIFNSNWDSIPIVLKEQVIALGLGDNNYMGNIIKAIMITASGAEGISLSNVRFVHITEPYWHPVRINQVIGRARRICSHKNLPSELQTVKVFLYLMMFTEEQLKDDAALELKLHDRSKIDPKQILTSDEALYEIANQKEKINSDLLTNIKEASIDCNVHNKIGTSKELKCFTFGSVNPNKFSYTPSIFSEDKDEIAAKNKTIQKLKLKNVTLDGQKYAYDSGPVKKENEDEKGILQTGIYSLETISSDNPIQIGILYFKNLKPKNYIFFSSKK